ncbi:MAG: signal peptidase II, partial [Thermoguttaceae bacterium]|nr:signal peptidase II [Thermoguttaceae bacterium]
LSSDSSSETPVPESDRPAAPRRLRALILSTAVAAVALAGDLWTKHLLFARLGLPGESDVDWVIPSIFGFQTSLNQGALFGIGQNFTWFFCAASLLALAVVVLWLWRGAYRHRLTTVALGGYAPEFWGISGIVWLCTACVIPISSIRFWRASRSTRFATGSWS